MAYNVLLCFYSKLQMAASQATVSRSKKKLEDKKEIKRKSLQADKDRIKPKDDEIICVLEAEKSKKEKELKNCYRIQCMTIKKSFWLLKTLIKSRYHFYINNGIFSLFVFKDWAKRCVFEILLLSTFTYM